MSNDQNNRSYLRRLLQGHERWALRVINPAKMKSKIKRKAAKILAKKAAKPILDA